MSEEVHPTKEAVKAAGSKPRVDPFVSEAEPQELRPSQASLLSSRHPGHVGASIPWFASHTDAKPGIDAAAPLLLLRTLAQRERRGVRCALGGAADALLALGHEAVPADVAALGAEDYVDGVIAADVADLAVGGRVDAGEAA